MNDHEPKDDPVDPEEDGTGEAEPGLVEEDDELDLDLDADDDPVVEEDDSAASLWARLSTQPDTDTDTDTDDEPAGSGPDEPPRRRRRWALTGLLGLVGVLAVLYAVGFVMTGLRMPANATIGGVDVSGMSPSAARDAVDRALSPHADDVIVLEHDDQRFEIDPQKAGLTLDLDSTIDEAGGRHSLNPATMLGLLFGEHRTAPVVDVDEPDSDGSGLAAAVASIAEAVDQEVVEPLITFPKTEPTVRDGEPGLVVRRGDTVAAITSAFLVTRDPVPVPTAVVKPSVDADGVAEAVRTIAEPAVSGPVIIQVGDKEVKLPVTAFAPALTIEPVGATMKPRIDAKALAEPLTDSTTGIGKKAVDATIEIRDGKAVVVPGKPGLGLQPEEMAVKLLPALTETGDARTVSVTSKVVEPERTTKEAKALKITEKISEFSTYFPYAEYRNINQSRAAELINGTIVEPGETFSFNDTVGERTPANGFVVGTVIHGGVFREELGGGVSQTVTTTYNAAFFGGMVDVEHHPHAFYLNRYPVGREATVYFGSLDLRFRNPTEYGVLIRAYVNKSTPSSRGEMHVELWSTKVWDIRAGLSKRTNPRSPGTRYDPTGRCVPQSPIPGFDVTVYRTFLKGGQVVKREADPVVYRAADHVICDEKPD